MAKTIEIGDQVTVGALAELLSIPVSQLISELFKNGIMATVNEKIDFDTAQIIVGELPDLEVELVRKEQAPVVREKHKISDKAESRPPVVAMMGHVDHGKTSLLDAIRGAEVTKGEAGGITQHLSAYQIKHNDRYITFLDTPGHEAFAALREHGARLTDLVVLVVAADDGIKPQTIEAIRFARQAGVKIIVAANKMDKATDAQFNQLKSQLAEQDLLPEDFGGDTIVLPVSAKEKTGINELLDMVLLVSDVEELKADRDVPGEGLVIEAHMEKYKKVLYLTISTGIGGGVIIDGIIDPAFANFEPGQMMFTYQGQPQKWESFASGKALFARYGKLADQIDDPAIWQDYVKTLVIGFEDLLATIQPEAVIIGGGVGAHFEKFEAFLEAELKQINNPMVPIPPLLKAQRAEEAVIYGCYDYIKQNV